MSLLHRLLATLGALLLAGPAAAQTRLPSPGPRTCATPLAETRQQAQLQRQLPGYRATKAPRRAAVRPQQATTYTLPVVVHVVHNGEAVGTGTNLSAAQVQSQLDVLNEDYRNRNANGALVPAAYQDLRADAQFQFQLATYGPGCQLLTEPGIDRIDRHARGWDAPPYGSRTDLGYIEQVIKPQTFWNPDQYLNIWVLDLGGGVLGYAQYPDNTAGLEGLSALGGLPETDGVVIRYSAFGRTGTLAANYDQGRTLTHELGHFLGLRHTWGDDELAADQCSGSDYVDDTPNQAIYNYGCPSFPHVSCANGPAGDLFMDFMDYVYDGCMQLFSGGQAARMQAVMAAGTPRRSSLASSPALAPATTATAGVVCAGSTATLRATGPAGARYAWSGPNGFTSTQQNPTLPNVGPEAAGTYTVTTTGADSTTCPATASATLVVPPAPLPSASQLLLACPGTPVTLTVANYPVAGLVGTTYAWSLVRGDGLPTAVNTPTIQVHPTQSSTYRLTVSTGGCTLSDTVKVYFKELVWTGAAGNGDWFDAANWDGGCVPNRGIDARIPSLAPITYPTISHGTAEVRTLNQQGDLHLIGGELALYGSHFGNQLWTQQGGTVAVRGTGYQVLHPGTYTNLLVAGPGYKFMNIGPNKLNGALTMQRGTLDPLSLVMGPTATLSETDSSYVTGDIYVARPVGTAPATFGNIGLVLTPNAPLGEVQVVRKNQPATAGLIQRTYQVYTASGQLPVGGTLSFNYFPHELNGQPADQLALFRATSLSTWLNEGATERGPNVVTRRYLPALDGTWTLGNPTQFHALSAVQPTLAAYPIPFGAGGLTVSLTTAVAGPVSVQVYDVLGHVVFSQAVLAAEPGASVFQLPALGTLTPGRYVLQLQQGPVQTRLQVVHE